MSKTRRFFLLAALVLLLFCPSAGYARERMALAIVLIRHGDRTPIRDYAACPVDWKIGVGELTARGMNQEYQLGRELRERYVSRYRLLPARYENNTVYARASDVNRTILSAECLLYGLYPLGLGPSLPDGEPALPGAFQPVPVRTVPTDQDRVLVPRKLYSKQCEELEERYVLTTEEWKKRSDACAPLFDRWGRIFGVKIRDLRDLIPLADNLHVRMLYELPLPEEITKDEAIELKRIADWAMVQQYRPEAISRLLAAPFFSEVLGRMQAAVEGRQQYRFILYSSHDTTLLPVMSAMGAPLDSVTPYAANICFELLDEGGAYSVRVRYNGKDIALPAGGGGDTCTFEQFRKAVSFPIAPLN